MYFVVKFSGPIRVVPPSPGPSMHELALSAVTNKSAAKLPLMLDHHGLRCLQVHQRTATATAPRALAARGPDAPTGRAPALDIMLVHKRLGHLNQADIKKLQHANAITVTGNFTDCETCLTTKSKRAAVAKKAQPRATLPGELIHTDINGPMSVPTLSGQRYAIEFIDDATRYVQVYLMKTKDEALSRFKQYVADMMPLLMDRRECGTVP